MWLLLDEESHKPPIISTRIRVIGGVHQYQEVKVCLGIDDEWIALEEYQDRYCPTGSDNNGYPLHRVHDKDKRL